MNEIMLELCKELSDPVEEVLESAVDTTIVTEADAFYDGDDDELINFINSGKKLEEDNFVDTDVDDTADDDDDLVDEGLDISQIEFDNTLIY